MIFEQNKLLSTEIESVFPIFTLLILRINPLVQNLQQFIIIMFFAY